MKLKVCGMKVEDNIREVLKMSPDYMGFIFYKKSPRYVESLDSAFIKRIDGPVKVGVFVNESEVAIMDAIEKYDFQMVQLHGEESLSMVKSLKSKGVSIIKVFRVRDVVPDEMNDFVPYCDLFLFDTRTQKYGGSGEKFDWSILKNVDHPFLLSGGIGFDDLEEIKKLRLNRLVGLDINSKVETSPGVKDIQKVKAVKALI